MNVVAKRFLIENYSIIIIIIDERGGEALSYWKLASLLLLLMNVVAKRFLIEN